MIFKFINIQLLKRIFFVSKNIVSDLDNIAKIEKVSITIKYSKEKQAFIFNSIIN